MMQNEWMMPALLFGFGLAAFFAAFARVCRFDRDRSFFPTVLIAIAGYYVLFAVMAGQSIWIEVIVATAFTGLAVIGGVHRRVDLGLMIVGGATFLHGCFDAVHGHVIDNPGVPVWWPAFCGAFDLLFGGWIVTLALRQRRALAPA